MRAAVSLFLVSLSACHVGGGNDGPDGGQAAADGGAPGPDAAPPDDDGGAGAPTLYPPDRTQSPITASVAAHLRAIAAAGPGQADDVFAKVGDSITVSTAFLRCFAGAQVDLGGRDELAATVAHFLGGDAAGTNPYLRDSIAAKVGWSARSAIAGDPSPLDQELAALMPRFAVVMFGSNDVELNDIFRYSDDMMTITDQLLAAGIIPILSSVPPRDDDAASDAQIPLYNEVVRGIAQGRQVPFIDYHREMVDLPGHGLGPDGLHPNVYTVDGAPHPCELTADGLQFGYNVRNLVTLEALDRSRRVVVTGAPAPDPAADILDGDGTAQTPFDVPWLPFTDLRDTSGSPSSNIDVYDGCAAAQDESGPEYLYRLEVTAPTNLRAMVFDRGDVDIDVHLLAGEPTGDACVARAHQTLTATVDPGVYYLSLDSFVPADGTPRAGEYVLVVVAE